MLNREPMGMKPIASEIIAMRGDGFSAQPRADGDEAVSPVPGIVWTCCFSAQPRADGDEASRQLPHPFYYRRVSVLNREPMGMKRLDLLAVVGHRLVSVLNREPMGMKPTRCTTTCCARFGVSVLNREPMGMKHRQQIESYILPVLFQCSTASRWG